jgi:thymidylate synthase
MMPALISGSGPVETWLAAVDHLSDSGDQFHLVVNIADPFEYDNELLALLDPRRTSDKARSVLDVANTIFPHRSKHWNATDREFTDHYASAYRRLLARGPRSWGMYFLRLLDFGAKHVNQLERVVRGLSTWGVNHKAAFTIHFSSAETDAPRPLGAPCLQYCQFLRDEQQLSLFAVYRSHDYFLKALGNFIGLSRLLEYVAERTESEVGCITCHSTYAYLANNRTRALSLIKEVVASDQ